MRSLILLGCVMIVGQSAYNCFELLSWTFAEGFNADYFRGKNPNTPSSRRRPGPMRVTANCAPAATHLGPDLRRGDVGEDVAASSRCPKGTLTL